MTRSSSCPVRLRPSSSERSWLATGSISSSCPNASRRRVRFEVSRDVRSAHPRTGMFSTACMAASQRARGIGHAASGKLSDFVLWVAALVVGHGASPTPAYAEDPNVLIVVTDDQRATDFLSIMPNTRRLFGANRTRYTNAFAATPPCCPSRATILTGRYAHNTRVLNNNQATRLDPTTMSPRLLRSAGYQTALAGKFLNSWPATRRPPHFERYAVLLGRSYLYTNPRMNVNGSIERASGYSTTLVRRSSLRFLRRFERRDGRLAAVRCAFRAAPPGAARAQVRGRRRAALGIPPSSSATVVASLLSCEGFRTG
jgi:Sulfatase